MATERSSKAASIEDKITKRIAAAGIRLRFDKVALRLLDSVKAGVGRTLPPDQSLVFTVTAPIRLPAKTSAAIQQWLHPSRNRSLSATINRNDIRVRIVNGTASYMPRVIGFVHNPESNADVALDIAEMSLRER